MTSPWPAHYGRHAAQVCAAIVLLVLCAFAPFLVGPYSVMDGAGDTTSIYHGGAAPWTQPIALKENDPGATAWQNEAWLAIEGRELHAGRLPWWDPYDGYGKPFAAAQQEQPFFPLTMLAALHPSPHVWSALVAARLALAGVFAALFVLWFGGRLAAVGAGAATAFSGYFLLYYGMPHMSVETLIPAMLWATEWCVRRPGPGSTSACALVIGAAFLGGMPESEVILIGTSALYLAGRLLIERRSMLSLLPWAAGVGLGAALAGVMLVPLFELLGRAFDIHRIASRPMGLWADSTPPLRSLLEQLAPLALGRPLAILPSPGNLHPAMSGNVTIVPFFAALLAVCAARSTRVTPAFRAAALTLAAIVVLFVLKNEQSPLVQWIGTLPVLRLAIFPKYDEPAIASCVGLLCGLGIAAVQAGAVSRRAAAIAAAVTLCALTGGYLWAVNMVPSGPATTFFYGSTAFALVALGAACAAVFARSGPRTALLAGCAAIGTIGAMYAPLYTDFARLPRATLNPYNGAPFTAVLRARVAATHDRVLGVGGVLTANWSGALGLEAPTAVDAIYPNTYLPFVDAFLSPPGTPRGGDYSDRFTGLDAADAVVTPLGLRWLTLSSVRYLAAPAETRLLAAPLHALTEVRDVRLYENDDVLPRAGIFHRVRAVADESAALALLTAPNFDVHETLLLQGTHAFGGTGRAADERADLIEHGPERAVIAAQLRSPGWVMLNDTDYPGWTATVDDAPAAIVTADGMFRAVAVGSGRHTIVFAYRSAAVARGEGVSGAALVVLAVLLIWSRTRKARSDDILPARAAR